MSDDTFEYTFLEPWDGQSHRGYIREIAHRFGLGDNYQAIVDCSTAARKPWTQKAFESGRLAMTGGLDDGDVLVIPGRGAEWPVGYGAEWREWPINEGDTLQTIFTTLTKSCPGVGKLIPAWDPPDPQAFAGATPEVSTLSFVWYYYRNRYLRQETLRATGDTKYGQQERIAEFPKLTLKTTIAKTIWLPIIPPVRVSVPVAPSPSNAPQTGATVEVQPNDKFHVLLKALANVETQLDGIEINRNKLMAVKGQGEAILKSLRDLKASMKENLAGWEEAAAAYDGAGKDTAERLDRSSSQPDPSGAGRVARVAALEKLDELIATASLKIGADALWRQVLRAGEAEQIETDIANATQTVRKLIDKTKDGAEMMALLVEICPQMYDAPVADRRGVKTTLLNYACGLAARAAVAMANSAEVEDWHFVWDLADKYNPGSGDASYKYAGTDSANLIEYALACTIGFDEKDHLRAPTRHPEGCLSVVLSIRFQKDLEAIAAHVSVDGDGKVKATDKAKALAKTACKAAVGKIMPLLVALGLAKEADEPEGIFKKFHDGWDLYKGKGESIETGTKALKLAEYAPDTLKAFAGGVLVPFSEEDASWVSKFIPKGMKSFATIAGVLWDVAGAESEVAEGASKSDGGFVSRIDAGAKVIQALGEASQVTLEGAKTLKLFAMDATGKQLLAFGKGAEVTIKVLGRASLVLGAVSETAEIYLSAKDGKFVEAAGHALGATGYVCLFVASVGGAPVFVAVGTGLLLGDIILTKGALFVSLYKGDTVERFEQITDAPSDRSDDNKKKHAFAYVTTDWGTKLGFTAELTAFAAAFNAADFKAATLKMALARAAPMPSRRAQPGVEL